jgi:hypothetical protein
MADRDGSTAGRRLDRRTLLTALAGAGTAALAGCAATESGGDATATAVDEERASELAARFAPTLYFDEHEPWFPTDPRPYATEVDGETVVDGFDAFDGYHERFAGETPPDPTVFYHVVEYETSPLAVVQYWFYSAFDQFTTNFHWHDWEVLHVFVDTETSEPQLFVASSHSRRVPNNEFLDPDPETVPRILAELGSHSSALSVDETPDRFQRVADDDGLADITNSPIETLKDVAALPFAYGLPRDEGGRLPYVVPEYEGAPLYDHADLPSVDRSALVDEALTVRSYDALSSPPTNLPGRRTGVVFEYAGRDGDDANADVQYDLVPTADVEHVAAFTGPQLSFEFAVPGFVEDVVAGHITTTDAPWSQPRYANPAADISDPNHRAALAERYDAIGDAAPVNVLVARLTDAVESEDAPAGQGLTTVASTLEGVALLESDPEAVPSFGGVVAVTDVPAGDHRLTVNRAGTAPHAETVSVGDGGDRVLAGVRGEIPLVASERARKLELDPDAADSDLARLAVEDDFAGRLYDAPLDGPDAVYVHAGGAYTAEVRDAADEVGAFRVVPDPDPAADDALRIERPNTGKASLATYLADVSRETQHQVAAAEGGGGGRSESVDGLAQALGAVADAAERAAERARAGDRGGADRHLETVASRLERVTTRLSAARGDLPPPVSNATDTRLEQSRRRTRQAKRANKL